MYRIKSGVINFSSKENCSAICWYCSRKSRVLCETSFLYTNDLTFNFVRLLSISFYDLKIKRYREITSIKTRKEKTGQTIVKVFHWEKPNFSMPQRSRTHARTFFSSDHDRVFYGKKRKAFLQTAKTIFEKYTDSINTTGHTVPTW